MNQKVVRIAHIAGKLAAGGVESVIFNYYKHIDHNRYQFDIYYDDDSTVEPPKELIATGARFIKIPRYQHLAAYLKTLTLAFKREKYQIVHSHINTLSVFPLLAAWIAGVPVRIAHSHSIIVKGEGKRTMLKYCLRPFSKLFSTHYAACSRLAAESLFGKKTVNKRRVTIIKNAIDTSRFIYNVDLRNKMRSEIAIEDQLLIGHAGRFTYAKNHAFIIDVFACLQKKYKDAYLLLVGDGELMQKTKEYIACCGLSERVILVGAQTNIARFYQAMDVFLFPSFFEGLGLAAIEAQASGLPVVMSTEVPEEAVLSMDTLRISLNASAEAWAEHVENVWKKRQGYDRKIGQDEVSSNGYEIRTAAKKIEKYYSDCMLKSIERK